MSGVESLQKALEQFRDFVGTTPIQDGREIILKGKILVEFQKVLELFSVFQKTHDAWTQKVHDGILGLYRTADHLGHEDERNSCAYLLRDLFNFETEEGVFGGLFLKEKTK